MPNIDNDNNPHAVTHCLHGAEVRKEIAAGLGTKDRQVS
jgi:hypothetical protein